MHRRARDRGDSTVGIVQFVGMAHKEVELPPGLAAFISSSKGEKTRTRLLSIIPGSPRPTLAHTSLFISRQTVSQLHCLFHFRTRDDATAVGTALPHFAIKEDPSM